MAIERKGATENSNILKASISKLDVDAVGVTSLAEWKGTKLEESALRLLPEARSVLVFAMEVYPEFLALASPGKTMGVASLNDLLDRNSDFLSGRLTKAAYDVARACHSIGLKALPLPAAGCPLDTRFLQAVFSYKHAAQAAGLGKMGWHSLLITPGFGPRVRLSACLTEAELEPTTINMTLDCESCGICVDSCPAGALAKPKASEQYAINKFACSSFRSASGACSECMRVCPAGR
ncbi:4Fe-4S binding protein [Chloroflexota bacterium]